ncbi:MAG: ABC transporter permease [Gemmatimonadetes bacterium]|nr:ABC transporter permease [Gemmatimonadota bacterium]NNM07191.1 ABC transporter permease [Gemmatimonadota bacterium]
MSDLFQDLRFALRTLARQPAFGLTAVGMLALGIGANAAIFGIFNGFFLRPLPFSEPGQLIRLDERAPRWDLEYVGMPYPDFHFWRERNETFRGMAVAGGEAFALSDEGSAERLGGASVTHDMAEVLGIQPILGRDFSPEDDLPGAPDIVLLSEGLWEERWGRDPEVVGQVIRLDARPHEIVGVLPDEAAFIMEARLWTPLRAEVEESSNNYFLFGIGRLRDGVPLETALADLERIHANLKEDGPASDDTYPILEPVLERIVGDARGPLLALMASVGLLLLIACANIAGLMLARALAREKEVGIRVALGASRGRIVRQLLTESFTLAALGGALGSLLGVWGSSALIALSPDEPPPWVSFDPDYRFLIFVVGIVGLTAILSGLIPALRATGTRSFGISLDAATRSTGSMAKSRGLKTLVVGEVALSVVLLAMAGLGIRDFQAVMSVEPGFETEGILTYGLALPSAKYEDDESILQFWDQYLDRVRALPGAEVVGATSATPLGGHWGQFFRAEGAPELGPDDVAPVTLNRVVSPGYLEAMGIRLLSGRFFTEADGRDEGSRAVILNETWARANFPDEDPVGKRIQATWEGAPFMTVVGVTEDTKHYGLDEDMRQGIFQPLPQVSTSWTAIVFRTSLDPLALVPQIRQLTRDADPDVPVVLPRTMQEILDQSLWPRKIVAWLFGGFALMALVLAVGGIYGVLSYTVTQRNLEIGIRMALGARDGQVLGQVLARGMTLVGIGAAFGLLGAYAMARAISSIFFGVGTGSPVLYGTVVLILLGVGVLANLLPARKAARVSPVGALRSGE